MNENENNFDEIFNYKIFKITVKNLHDAGW